MANEGSILPQVAAEALAAHFAGRAPKAWPASELLNQERGVFVTIRNGNGELRGCRGCVEPQHDNLIEATQSLSLSSALQDTRFPPIQADELDTLHFEVSVIEQGEEVDGPEDLDAEVFGILISTTDGRRGFMLPNVPGLETPEKQLAATRQKANISADEPIQITRYRVRKY